MGAGDCLLDRRLVRPVADLVKPVAARGHNHGDGHETGNTEATHRPAHPPSLREPFPVRKHLKAAHTAPISTETRMVASGSHHTYSPPDAGTLHRFPDSVPGIHSPRATDASGTRAPDPLLRRTGSSGRRSSGSRSPGSPAPTG